MLSDVLTRRQFVGAAVALAALPKLTSRRPLWTARKNGRVVYIVGETWPRSDDWHDPVVEDLLRQCGHLWTETNQIFRQPAKSLVEQFGTATDASPLKLLPSEQQARLQKAAELCGVSLTDLAGMRPWVVGSTLEDAFYEKTGLTGKSARQILTAQADAARIPISSEFATKDDVFTWLGGLSPQEDAQFLCYELDGVLLGRTGSEHISSAWLAGRTEPAAAFVDHERRAYPELYIKLTTDRNRRWVPQFDAMILDPKPTMVIIGMFHLVGDDSVLAQLRRTGFSIAD